MNEKVEKAISQLEEGYRRSLLSTRKLTHKKYQRSVLQCLRKRYEFSGRFLTMFNSFCVGTSIRYNLSAEQDAGRIGHMDFKVNLKLA